MDFFTHHIWITLVFLVMFPRLTLLIASFATGGLLWWLGFIFYPSLLIAILSIPYWSHNPILVIIAWIVAISKLEITYNKAR